MEADGFTFDFGSQSPDCQLHPPLKSALPEINSETISFKSFNNPTDCPVFSLNDCPAWRISWPILPANRMEWRPKQQKEGNLEIEHNNNTLLVFQRAPSNLKLSNGNRESDVGDESLYADIIPGCYYGGFKVWSCAPDLCNFLNFSSEARMKLIAPGTRVVELGCGQGLPGMLALILGAMDVTFQDYNAEVLESCIKSNIAANFNPSDANAVIRLTAGDWVAYAKGHSSLEGIFPDAGACFDVILGSDVTFDVEACERLVRLIHAILLPTGTAYIGTKEYYFGTNGGLLELEDAINRCNKMLSSHSTDPLVAEVVQRIRADGEMHRAIVKITRNHSQASK